MRRRKLSLWVWVILAGFGGLLSLFDDPAPPSKPAAIPAPPQLVEPDKAATVAPRRTALPAPSAPLAPAPSTAHVVTASSLNLRSGPGTTSAVVGSLPRGRAVEVIETRQGWARLRVQGQGEGWVAARYLAPAPPGTSARPVTRTALPAAPQRRPAVPGGADLTRARAQIIRQSIAAYPGPCPCPYSINRGGRRCGGTSAWSRPGGYEPLCYDGDVTQAHLASYLARLRGAVD